MHRALEFGKEANAFLILQETADVYPNVPPPTYASSVPKEDDCGLRLCSSSCLPVVWRPGIRAPSKNMGNTGSNRLCDFSWAHDGAAQSASAPNPAVAAPAEQRKEVKKKKPKKGKRTQVSATQSKPALPRSEAKKPSAKPPNKVHPSMPRHVSMPVHRVRAPLLVLGSFSSS